MILDNADDLSVLFDNNAATDSLPLASYLPKTAHGRILITSRSLDVTEKLTGGHKAILRISTMADTETLQVFQNTLDRDFQEEEALELVHALDCIPLAVKQAASYINRRGHRVSIRSYIKSVRDNVTKKKKLLLHDSGDIRRSESASNSIVLTWQITFNHIRQEHPAAASLLSLMSFFHPQNIPEDMLCEYNSLDNENESDLEDDLDVLLSYTLVHITSEIGFYEIHSLVQFCTQVWLSDYDDLARWGIMFLKLMSEHFPSGNSETWPRCRTLLPHVQSVLENELEGDTEFHKWCNLSLHVSRYYTLHGDHARAGKLLQKLMETGKSIIGQDHPRTLVAAGTLVDCYLAQARLNEAEILILQITERSKRVFGEDHRETLENTARLAHLYEHQGRWKEAELLQLQLLEAKKRALGEDDVDTITALDELATTYYNQGRHKEAESLILDVIDRRKRAHGEDSIYVMASKRILVLIYRYQGRLRESELLILQLTENYRKLFGDDHRYTSESMADLASVYYDQRRWNDAEPLLLLYVGTLKYELGDTHPDTLAQMGTLANVYNQQGRFREANPLFDHVSEASRRNFGDEHPKTLEVLGSMVSVYRRQGRLDEAETLGIRVVEAGKRVLGENHYSTFTFMAHLAAVYQVQQRWCEAEVLLLDLLNRTKCALGEDHPFRVNVMRNLGYTLRALGRDEAVAMMEMCRDGYTRMLGENHAFTVEAKDRVAAWQQDISSTGQDNDAGVESTGE
jgi:hypothetical protein